MKDDKKSIKNNILKCLKKVHYVQYKMFKKVHYIQYKKVYEYIKKTFKSVFTI